MAQVLYEDPKVVVRGEWVGSEFKVYVHPKADGKEIQPRGYWLGSNSLVYELPKKV